MKVHTEDENAFVFHINDFVDFENKEFYEQNLGKLDDVSILIYDDNGENPNFKYRLHTDYERFSFDMSEVNMTKAGIYPVYVTDKKDSAIRTSFNITVKSVEESTTTTTATTDNNNSTTTTTTTTTVTTENETSETTTTVTTLPQTGYSSLYNYMMLLAAAITTFGGYVMAKARKKFNNN
jgi:LPXTG-motif cell wall-anchored protein